jgi:putative phosphoesterase
MRIALLADIHANLYALEAVWDDLARQRPDATYGLGDLVGYGMFPNEVVEFLRARSVPGVMGNFDEGVAFNLKDSGSVFRDRDEAERGRTSLRWTQEHATSDTKTFLRGLPMQLRLESEKRRLILVHGTPRAMNESLHESSPDATFEQLARLSGAEVLCFGHTHVPFQKKVGGVLFVNAGSVGLPQGGDPRSGYVLLSTGRRLQVEFRKIAYDVEAAARAAEAAGGAAGMPPVSRRAALC